MSKKTLINLLFSMRHTRWLVFCNSFISFWFIFINERNKLYNTTISFSLETGDIETLKT